MGAFALANYIADLVNFDIASYAIDPQVWLLELAVGLGVPLIAAFVPIRSATNTTVREALSDQGMNLRARGSFIDRMLRRVRGLSRPYILSMRNTFRRKTRLLLTLTTLILGGGIFIAVFTVRASLLTTLDGMFDYIDYDVVVSFPRGIAPIACWTMPWSSRAWSQLRGGASIQCGVSATTARRA